MGVDASNVTGFIEGHNRPSGRHCEHYMGSTARAGCRANQSTQRAIRRVGGQVSTHYNYYVYVYI